MAEQHDDATRVSCKQPVIDEIKKEDKDEKDLDEFDKKWDDIQYLIRKQFCCK
ncbi:MAG: hypothetical protein Q6373_000200 [Candidatus Sigynarchaeota archaeon]